MARKHNSRCLPTNAKIKMDGRPPPEEYSSSSPIGFLQENFENFVIGARKKEVKSVEKEDEVNSGGDSDSQDVNILEKWSSMDRITVDGSESSEWGRSISSSMSWFDESEYEATLKVKSMLDNIDCMLYGEAHTPLPKPLVEECQQWRQRFPHLRVVGSRIAESVTHETESNLSSSECKSAVVKEENVSSSREILEESEEEIYACHGEVQPQQSLSHEIIFRHESMKDQESERIKEALLNELATHVWKEVFVPSFKNALEKQKSSRASSSLKDEVETSGNCMVKNESANRNSDVKSDSSSDKQFQSGKSLSAREERAFEQIPNELSDTSECYRRYSDQLSYCDVKCGSDFMSLEMVEEKDYENQELNKIKSKRISRNSGKDFYLNNSKEVKVKRETSRRPQERRLQSSSRKSKKFGVVEDLRPIKKASAWTNSVSEGLDGSGNYMFHKENKHLILPAIEHQGVTHSYEPSSFCMGRSSSALPKLPNRSLRPTMSSYQNKALLQAEAKKDQKMKYQEVNLSESCMDSLEKIKNNTGYYSGFLSSKSTKNRKRRERKLSSPHNINFAHS